MNIKYGMHYIYWQTDLQCKSYVPYVAKVKQLGFDVLELGDYLILNLSDEEVDELASAAREYDVELSIGLDPPQDSSLTAMEKESRDRGVLFYEKVMPRLKKLGIRCLGGNLLNGVPLLPSSEYASREWEYGIDSIRRIADRAAEYGIGINIEICNRYESHILNTAAQGTKFVQETGRDNVKILLDTFHMNIEEDSFYDAFTVAGKYLGHVHLGENHRRLPGRGHLPWNEIRDGLKAADYHGIMTMEPLVSSGDELGDCCRVWRDMTDDADEEGMDIAAKEALCFMKYLFRQNG